MRDKHRHNLKAVSFATDLNIFQEVIVRQRVASTGAFSAWWFMIEPLCLRLYTPKLIYLDGIMFESLSDRLSGIFNALTGKGALSAADVDAALREVRRALLEADVALPVAKGFIEKVRERAIGSEVVKSVTPGQQVVKIVHDVMVDVLGQVADPIDLNAPAPFAILMVGLQGSGKTTSTAKIAKRLGDKNNLKVLMASLDTRRPAAMEQLLSLGQQYDLNALPIVEGQDALAIAKRAMEAARLGGYDVVLLDTAGRTTLDEALMEEASAIQKATNPHEVLLVVDSLTGQDAVNTARTFDERLGITGTILTRMDGDGRGGAALSMRAVTGKPIKLIGTGEKADALEEFHPERIASRILGMGDIVSLVEKASSEMDQVKAEKLAKKLQKGSFDLDDMAQQMQQMLKMGGMGSLMGMMPGMGKVKKQMSDAQLDDKVIKRQIAIVSSMTPKERSKPDILKASRKKRIAKGSGVDVSEVNKLLKMHRQMADMMKKMRKNKGMFASLFGGGSDAMAGGGAGPDPSQFDPAALEKLAKQSGMGGALGGANPLGALGGMKGGNPLAGLPGLGGSNMPKLPGLANSSGGTQKKGKKS
jgi:signal recognition particle subunit SRP54